MKPRNYLYRAPNYHLIIYKNQFLVKRPEGKHIHIMRSAAYWFGPPAIGVVLTGRLGDGTSGLWSIKQMGGITIVQQPIGAP